MSWDEHRRYLFAVAYRMLGDAQEAEDAVQEAFVRLHAAGPAPVRNPRAWLTTVTSRICLDLLGSARARHETYVGTWLPEPLAATDDSDLGDTAALRESVRTAVLLVMRTLSPAERVAFVLHDVFGMDFDQLASVVGRTAAACRQLASRARRRIREQAPPRATVSAREHEDVTAAFLRASAEGEIATLISLLDPHVVLRSDGGGQVPAARVPVFGPQQVTTLLSGLGRRYAGVQTHPVALASGPGFVLDLRGTVIGVVSLEIVDGRITELNLTVNPSKLSRFAVPSQP